MHRILAAAAVLCFASPAWAANILFVSDSSAETAIADVLEADGHTVTRVLDDYVGFSTPTLQGDLSPYDAVFWAANGTGGGGEHDDATVDAVEAYARAGGMVFITGNDTLASPIDLDMYRLIGTRTARDVPGDPAPLIDVETPLTTGVVDLRGVTPTGAARDRDAATNLQTGTLPVSGTRSDAQWTLRPVGGGIIAYVSAGVNSTTGSDRAWTVEGGAYNGAIRNFAHAADERTGPSRVLYVSDSGADAGLVGVLEADGHAVTASIDEWVARTSPALEADLSTFDAIVWTANGGSAGGLHDATTTDAAGAYVAAGGRLLVTGYDAVSSPTDTNLIALLGCTGEADVPEDPGPIADVATSLTIGLFDLRGVTPTGLDPDRDSLLGCGDDVTVVATSSDTADEVQWSVRTLGAGEVAWLSNGQNSSRATHASWTDETNAAHRAVRNFAFNAPASLDFDFDGDGAIEGDCDPLDPALYPGAIELCDGINNDCVGATPDGAGEDGIDAPCDGDDTDLCTEGTRVCTGGTMVCTDDTGDDLEVCDGEDNDCDPDTADGHDDARLGLACDGEDADRCDEGTIVCAEGSLTCEDPTGDDLEVCDGEDNDCDGVTDDADDDIARLDPAITGARAWYRDADADGCGDPEDVVRICADGPLEGRVDNARDADDSDEVCCGNGALEPGEICDGADALGDLPVRCEDLDDGYVSGTISCAATCDGPDVSACVANACGDGVTAGDETCDDGGTDDGDGCDATCRVEAGWACDGIDRATSECDDTCGDGVVDAFEACDDGNTDADDGCDPTCAVELGWACDTDDDGTTCAPECGDGRTLGDERCDDGNTDADDGCGPTCAPEPGFVCLVIDTVSTCEATCGDGALDAGERCDDGNLDAEDGCDPTCRIETGWLCGDTGCEPACGDGLVRGAEADTGGCDDGNRDGGDGCDAVCLVEENYLCTGEPSTCSLQAFCGDGAIDDGEACDDGNDDDGDGCSARCATESGWLCDEAAPTACVPDADDDGVADADDNCPDDANGDQADLDDDGAGDSCDDDRDGDGVANDDDACPDAFGEGDDGCDPTGGDVGPDAGGEDAGSDAGGGDAGGLDAGGTDADGADSARPDAAGSDAGGTDGGGTDAGAGGPGASDGGGGGCAAAPTSSGGAAGLGLLALLGLVATRRRRR